MNATTGTCTYNEYEPFGEDFGAANGERYKFTGKEDDGATGLSYLNDRYYDPQIGRFISEDIAKDGANWYLYCYNNPLRYKDPSGKIPLDTIIDVACVIVDVGRIIAGDKSAIIDLQADIVSAAIPYASAGAVKVVKTVVGKADDVVDATKAVKVAKAAKTVSVVSSKKLGDNLVSAGIKRPNYPHAAHHIVAGGAEKAKATREILEKFKIDINDAANGVFLSAKKDVGNGAYHPSLHTNEYYKKVYDLLKKATNREEAIEILEEIGEKLSNDSF